MLYVNFLCQLSRYLSPIVEICYVLNVCRCVFSLSQSSSIDLLYVKCLCVLSRYLSSVLEFVCVVPLSVICQLFVSVVSLSQPSSRDLLCVKCLSVSRFLVNSVQ